ncbi:MULTISPECIES: hypothetical protein [Chryseobacterium]|uniref:Uncharacterized protein n=1 Tax=Chryseobacterium camelliae TaxID=1265445 RepID=A0ABU0TD49_9FLAO|nr:MULTISPECIES: hypothetical protein [Chryseobacterium]MDT3407345.1 hypothetical protein [Pseudacidovorax intermedius]MDQ1094866.1 hypothetical protein [Chryseobacterium camelliae]MDQ1098806.1 hypothetical protein [Chryseobacterium sp. SORGH_AS_1048]MDR6086157.1 hypothetical protein [Chryseobacterium sp. SORGH_AS_0909]MDR6130527.1 hypothetical protein [Chryseobacterium sp. SORGH_AS_1175]
MSETEQLVGGWTRFHELTAEDQKVFDEAMQGFVGVKYSPKEVSTQVVNGMNYRFKSQASMPPSDVVWQAVIEVYKPINGTAHVVAITRI